MSPTPAWGQSAGGQEAVLRAPAALCHAACNLHRGDRRHQHPLTSAALRGGQPERLPGCFCGLQRGMQLLPEATTGCVCVCVKLSTCCCYVTLSRVLLWFLSLWTFLFSTQRRGKGGNSDMEPIDKWLITQGMVRTSPRKRFLLPTPVPLPRITTLHSPLILPYSTT